MLFKQQLRQNSKESEVIVFSYLPVSGKEKHWKSLKELQFFTLGTRSNSVSSCCFSSRYIELGFTSFSEKEHDIWCENEDYYYYFIFSCLKEPWMSTGKSPAAGWVSTEKCPELQQSTVWDRTTGEWCRSIIRSLSSLDFSSPPSKLSKKRNSLKN